MPKLTQKVVKALELPAEGQKFVWDTALKGFGVRLTPSKKVFVVQGRVNGRDKRITIASCETFSADEARKKAKAFLQDMANGLDPNAERKRAKLEGITLAQVTESYIKDRSLKPSSVRDINRHLDYSFPAWKDKPITKINRDAVLKLYRKRSEVSQAQANQAFRILRALLNYARATYRPGDQPIIPENPVQVISDAKIWHRIEPRSRRIPMDQVGEAMVLLENMQADPVQTMAGRLMVDAVVFCLFTGARWGEASKLTWDNVNLEAGTWHIKDPKNKNSVTLPLSSQALTLLQNRPQIENNPYVFCSDKSKTGYVSQGKFITDQLSTDLKTHISPHDLRRTFRSIAADCDIELWRTKMLMNHKIQNDVTISAYTERSNLEYLRPGIQAIGDWIERQAVLARNKVVELKARREAV